MNASRQSFIVSALLCALMAALFVARYRLAPYPVEAPFEGGMPLVAALTRLATEWPGIAAVCIAAVVLWTLLVVVQLTIRYGPAGSRNYLPAQIYLVAVGGIVISGEAPAAILVAWLVTLASKKLAFSFHKEYRFGELFHGGFYLGLAPLLYAPAAVVVLPAAVAALVIYRRSVREAVVCMTGLLLPVPAAGFIHWATGTPGDFIYRELWRCATVRQPFEGSVPWLAAVVAALVLILTLVAVMWAAGHKKNVRKAQSKFMQHTSLLLLLAAVSALVPGTTATLAALVAVPCTLSVPYAFPGKLASISTFLYCLILATVLILDLLPVVGISVP